MRLFYSIILTLFTTSLIAQVPIKDKNKNNISIFADFEQLGMQKDTFIQKFGTPTAKDMSYDKNKNKIETLHYIELLSKGKLILDTKFIFINNELIEQKCNPLSYLMENEMLNKIYDDLELIYFHRK